MQKTFVPKNPGTNRKWFLVDAAGKPLGRLAVNIANTLRGKDRPTFSPAIDQGDFVIVINAEKVLLTGRKLEQKDYQRLSRRLETLHGCCHAGATPRPRDHAGGVANVA